MIRPLTTPLVSLEDGAAYHQWLTACFRDGVTTGAVLEILARDASDMALVRSAQLCLLDDRYSAAKDFAVRARLSNRPEIRAFADALLARATIFNRSKVGQSETDGAFPILPALHKSLSELVTIESRSLIKLEAECVLRLTLAIAYQQVNKFQDALEQASETLLLAESLGLSRTRQSAMSIITGSLVVLGRLGETLRVLQHERLKETTETYFAEEYARQSADILLSLGDHRGAYEVLDTINPEARNDLIKAWKQLYKALLGEADPHQGIYTDYTWAGSYVWLTQAMFLLTEVTALPRLTATMAKREALLRDIIALSKRDEKIRDPWVMAMESWIRGLAHLWLGEVSLASNTLDTTKSFEREWLDLRCLHAALRLEVSLNLNDPPLQNTRRCEEDLRAVFEDARALPYASRAGLAERMKRWHPLAAAYAAVMPTPITELASATESILKSGQKCTVYGFVMPPVYAAELIFRCLGFDTRRNYNFVQAPLNKVQICQRDVLLSTFGNTSLWLPVISVPHLIYGLTKAGDRRPEYRQTAQNLAHDFGIVPVTKTAYAELELSRIAHLTQHLLSDTINPQQFAEMIQ